jgi:MEMO1 family protein
MDFKHSARPSPIAGTWYTTDPKRLETEIHTFIDNAVLSDNEFQGEVFGVVAPHAGYIYSGKTAGYAYRVMEGLQRDIVVVLSPFHQYHGADLLTTVHDSYVTPLGAVPVETEILAQLNESIPLQQVEHDPEHALEIQLPFIQCALSNEFSLLPLMVRTRERKKLKRIAEDLMDLLQGRSFLIVASTDLSHYSPLETAHQMDAEMLRRIKAMDAEGVLAAEGEGAASACGASSVALLLYAARMQKDPQAFILNYSTSADATGDTSSVVGYGAAAIFLP